jgi:hypothetical protein
MFMPEKTAFCQTLYENSGLGITNHDEQALTLQACLSPESLTSVDPDHAVDS